jgi:hypothetical protein
MKKRYYISSDVFCFINYRFLLISLWNTFSCFKNCSNHKFVIWYVQLIEMKKYANRKQDIDDVILLPQLLNK